MYTKGIALICILHAVWATLPRERIKYIHNENMPDYPFTDLDVTVLADLDVSPSDSTQPRGAPPGAVTPNAPPEPASSQAPATSAATSSREHGDDDMVAEHGYARPPQRGPATTPAVHADAQPSTSSAVVSEHDYAREPDHNGDPPPVAASMAGLPDMATVCNANVVTIKHVPKKCRQLWAQVLCRELQQVTREGNLTSLTRLFALPKAVLRVLPRGGAGNRNAMANAVKLRLQRWQKGELGALWEEAVAPVPKPRGRKPKKQEEQDEAKARQMRQVVAQPR